MSEILSNVDAWLDTGGPEDHVVVSSRARYARNLPRIPFPLRARPEELLSVIDRVGSVISANRHFAGGMTLSLADIKPVERNFLKESHVISSEMEKGAPHRMIFLAKDSKIAVMVNEEDHLRMFALETGFRPHDTLTSLVALEDDLDRELHFAFSHKYGFLTACPTNTGTGLRASVMLHLPALSDSRKLPELFKSMPQWGLTVRGYYGENSENLGDFFQVSNELTLGKSENEIVQDLATVVEQIIEREEQARRMAFEQNRLAAEDEIWRAFGILTNARVMTSQDAVQFLSKLRMGVEHRFFGNLSHSALNKLIVEVQPGHLQVLGGGTLNAEARDVLRADLLRKRLANAENN